MSSQPQTLLLTRSDVARLLTLDDAIIAVEQAFRLHGERKAPPPGVLGVHAQGGGFHIKAGLLHLDRSYFAAKLNANFFANAEKLGLPNIQGVVLLSDGASGSPLAVMDSIEITIQRTGAATAVAAKRLARPDSAVLGIVGCGVQGRTNLEALAAVLPDLAEVRAYDLHPERARAYAVEQGTLNPRVRIVLCATPREAVEGCDVIVTAGPIRRHPQPVLEAAWFSPGALGVPLDYDSCWTPAAMAAADRFYTDDAGQLLHTRAGGVYFRGIPELYADLGEVLAGLKDGRRTPRERLVCMNLGIALEDMATAPLVLERARAKGVGIRLPL
jgi:ornithine cyclodeaminase/alanine dehydrogenase